MCILRPLYCTHLSFPAGGMCPDEVDSVWKIQWSATAVGSFLSVVCVENKPKLGIANRLCLAGGVWDTVDATECESEDGNRQDGGRLYTTCTFMNGNGYTNANSWSLSAD